MMALRLIKMFFHVVMICLMLSGLSLSGLSLSGLSQSQVFASDDSLISLADFQQKSMPLMLEAKGILQLSDGDLIDLLNFPLEEAWRNGQLNSSDCDQAFQQAIQKHLQIQSIRKQVNQTRDQFKIWNQAPSLRARSNVIHTDFKDPQQLNAKIGMRIPLPVDVFERKKAWDAQLSVQHWSIEKEKEELQNLIHLLNLNLYEHFRLLLLKTLSLRYMALKIKQIENILKEGLIEKNSLEKLKLDMILLEDDWENLFQNYQKLQYDLYELTHLKMIKGQCLKAKDHTAKIKLLEAQSNVLIADRNSKEGWQINFIEMGWQQQQMMNMGYLSIAITPPWHDPSHQDHLEILALQEEKLIEMHLLKKEEEKLKFLKNSISERIEKLKKHSSLHPKILMIDFDWMWWIKMNERKYEGYYELLRLMDED